MGKITERNNCPIVKDMNTFNKRISLRCNLKECYVMPLCRHSNFNYLDTHLISTNISVRHDISLVSL